MLADAAGHALVVTAEDGVRHGGAGAFLTDALATMAEAEGTSPPASRVLGIPRQYLAQGRPDEILSGLGLDAAGIAESVRRARAVVPVDADWADTTD
jgi:1-deoxy-D-xylulose-5-phosphate synthase